MPLELSDFYTMLGVLVSAGGLGIVIFYNALKVKQNTKSRYYTILKDLHDRFHQIHEANEDEGLYRAKMLNFALFMEHLIQLNIINKKDIIKQYETVFSQAFWLYKNIDEIDLLAGDKEFIKFCEKNKIKEIKPLEANIDFSPDKETQ